MKDLLRVSFRLVSFSPGKPVEEVPLALKPWRYEAASLIQPGSGLLDEP